jgi:Domain of unknown function (DUF4167)
MKRQRGRGRSNNKPGMQNPNRAYESTGPDVKVRGSAQTIMEKYLQLGRDCMASGDRIIAENYFQHAEHYLRLIKAIQPNFVPRSEFAIAGIPSDDEDGEEGEIGENENSQNDADDQDDDDQQQQRPRENNNRYDNNNRYNNNNRRNNNNNNNRGRERFRPDNRQNPENQNSENPNIETRTLETEAPIIENQGAENHAPIENNDENQRRPRVRGLRIPRKPREPREPRETSDAPAEGFGNDTPAFLQAPVLPVDAQ